MGELRYQNLFIKCNGCGEISEREKLIQNSYVCALCGYHEIIDYKKRIAMVIDQNTFEETNAHAEFYDPIKFPGYEEKHERIVC